MGLLDISDLAVRFRMLRGDVHAVNGVDLTVEAGSTVALVGESGSGKSVTALAVLGLLSPAATVTRGRIDFDGRSLLGLSERQLRTVRGAELAMIFQDPMTGLNPVLSVGAQIARGGGGAHRHVPRRSDEAGRRAARRGRHPRPGRRAEQFPHEFSGGMRQRAMIAIAIACNPRLLIADEPTTALDVTVQAQILDLLRRCSRDRGMALLLITHDLGVVAGHVRPHQRDVRRRVVESRPTRELFRAPSHPYTRGLLPSIPTLQAGRKTGWRRSRDSRRCCAARRWVARSPAAARACSSAAGPTRPLSTRWHATTCARCWNP